MTGSLSSPDRRGDLLSPREIRKLRLAVSPNPPVACLSVPAKTGNPLRTIQAGNIRFETHVIRGSLTY